MANFQKAEVRFHKNMSLRIGMCQKKRWEKVSNGSWARSTSAFGHKVLDVRTASSSLENFEVSIEEGGGKGNGTSSNWFKDFTFHLLMFRGSDLSYLLYSFPRFWRSNLQEAGISEEMFHALVVFLVIFVILAGGWLGFWVVHKHIPTEDGSIDISTSLVVAWSIRILSALLILQCSVDPVLATEAPLLGVITSSILGRIFRLRIFCCVYRKLRKSAKRKHKMSHLHDSSALEDPLDEYTNCVRSSKDFSFPTVPQSKNFPMVPSSPSDHAFSGSGFNQLYISSFHTKHPKEEDSRSLTGKSSPEYPQILPWKSLPLPLVLGNGFPKMWTESQ